VKGSELKYLKITGKTPILLTMQLFNTLTKKREEFTPINPPDVRIYMCGMTVQDQPHLGHMRAFIAGDILRRYLQYLGYKVTYVQNFTDIDDKIINKSHSRGIDWRILTQRNIEVFDNASRMMNILPPDVSPRATLHIQEIIEAVNGLISKDIAYQAGDSVYFDISKFPSYGKLSGKRIDDLLAGYRVEPAPGKRNPGDFALWKGWKEGEPYWHSPFGKGRPGWHIECSVMSAHYLGQPFDIHGGGSDLIFPHHENEIAQAEALHESTFAQFWFHPGLVRQAGEKMAKSTGLFTPIVDLLERFSGNVIRLYLISTHYRSPIEFDWQALERAENSYNRLKNFLKRTPDPTDRESAITSEEVSKFIKRFEEAMNDDLNTPAALGVIFEMVKLGFETLESSPKRASDLKAGVEYLLKILGFQEEEDVLTHLWIDDLIKIIVDIRQQLRTEKRYDLADLIRNRLKSIGIQLEDTREGTKWVILPELRD